MTATSIPDAADRPAPRVPAHRPAGAEIRLDEEHLRLALEAGRLGTWRWDMASGLTVWDPTLEAIFGLPPGGFDGTFEAWVALLHPDDVPEVLAVVERAVAERSAYDMRHRCIWPDGTVRWLEGRGQVTLDADGQVTGTIGCTGDITVQVMQAAREAVQATVARALSEGTDLDATICDILADIGRHLAWDMAVLWLVDDRGVLHCRGTWTSSHLQPSAMEAVTLARTFGSGEGLPGRVLASGEREWVDDLATSPRFVRAEAAAQDGLTAGVAFPVRHGGATVAVLECFSRSPRRQEEHVLGAMLAVVAQLGQYLALLRAEARTAATVRSLLEQSYRLRRLSEVTSEIAGLSSVDEIVARTTDEAAALIGCSWAMTTVAAEGLAPHVAARLPGGAAVPAPEDLAGPPRLRHPVRLTAEEMALRPEWAGVVGREGLPALHGWLAVPLVDPGGVPLGLIELSHRRGGELSDDDEALLVQLATVAAAAIHKSLLYEDRARVAHVLQRGLLPPTLPDIPGASVAAVYRPGSELVGGDFYDVFALGDGAWGLVIGDVCGKGAEAASLTALARHTIRGAAMVERSPARVLELLNAALLADDHGARFCSAVLARLELAPGGAGRLTYSSAGHPPLLVARAGGGIEALESTGTLVGLFADVTMAEVVVRLEPGDLLVGHTDGLHEARSERGLFGEHRVLQVLAAHAGDGPAVVADALASAAETFADPAGRDDVAVLALQVD